MACNENLSLEVKDVIKYDYLRPFVINNYTEFEGHHNLDSEDFQFSYRTNNVTSTLSKIEENASKNGWQRRDLHKKIVSYSKKINIFESKPSLVVVILKIKKNDDRIYFEVN